MSKPIGLGLVGFGNIGAGVVRNLHKNRDAIARRLERPVRLVRIADLDHDTPRDTAGFDTAPLMTREVAEVLEAPDVDIVVELVGGYEPARTFAERALEAGRHVVTANKAMLARFGPELMATARRRGVQLLFEASVGGGIPIVRTLQQGLAANEFSAVYGILNGTTNYILTRMARHATPFDEALADAQAMGYAEPDPTFDIEGIDTAHKTAVLAWLAFGRPVRDDEVHAEGITRLAPADLEFAARNGMAIKMLGIARRGEGGAIELRAHPAMVPADSMLASVNDVYNAIMVVGEPIGPTLYFGQGAGPDATSSAVLSDVMALADGLASGGLDRESRLTRQPTDAPLAAMDDLVGAVYLRSDTRGDALFAALEKAEIGLARTEASDNGATMLVTDPVREGDLKQVLAPLGDAAPVLVRVLSLE